MTKTIAEYTAEAQAADDAWSLAMEAAGVERYTAAARGEPGSDLRALYDAKVAADAAMNAAWSRSRGEVRS